MIPNVTKMLDEIHRIYKPGMAEFFSKLEPDQWTKGVDELEACLIGTSPEVSLRAIAIYKYRRKKMLEIYQSYMELAQQDYVSNPIIEAIQKNLYADASEQTTRRLIRCDGCTGTPELLGSITVIASEETNENGDPHVWISTACRQCQKKRGAA